MMAEPWENDPDNLLEVTFRHDPRQNECAAAAVAAAVAEIGQGYPANPRADARRRARAERVAKAWPDGFQIIEWAVAEYLTREAQGRRAVALGDALAEAEALTRAAAGLQARIEAAGMALHFAEPTDSGAALTDDLADAIGHVTEAWQAANICRMVLERAARNMPTETRGRGGALSRLRLSPDVALFDKLASIWQAAGISTRAGDDGDALDVFIYHALKSADPAKVSGANWFGKLRERASAELSRENRTPK